MSIERSESGIMSRARFNHLVVATGGLLTVQELLKLVDKVRPLTGREINPLINTSLPTIKVRPVGSWPLDLDSPEAEALLLGSGAVGGSIVTHILNADLSRREVLGAILGAPLLTNTLTAGSQAVSLLYGKEGDSIEQAARLLREAPLYNAARRVGLLKGEAAEKIRQCGNLAMSLGKAVAEETENGLLYRFPIYNSGFEETQYISLIIAQGGLKPKLRLPSEIDPNLLTASPQQILYFLGPNARMIHAFGAMDYAGISFANELRANFEPNSPIVPNMSILYGSGGLIVTEEGSKDPNVWLHAKGTMVSRLNASTKEFSLRPGDPNQLGVTFHSSGWNTISQEELERIVNNRRLPNSIDALVLPQYTITSSPAHPMNVPFSEKWDRTLSFAFRYQTNDGLWRYGFASAKQDLLLSPSEMQSLAIQSMEEIGAKKFEIFCLDLGGNTGSYQLTQKGYYNPSQEVFIAEENGKLEAPPLKCTTHTCVSAITFEKG